MVIESVVVCFGLVGVFALLFNNRLHIGKEYMVYPIYCCTKGCTNRLELGNSNTYGICDKCEDRIKKRENFKVVKLVGSDIHSVEFHKEMSYNEVAGKPRNTLVIWMLLLYRRLFGTDNMKLLIDRIGLDYYNLGAGMIMIGYYNEPPASDSRIFGLRFKHYINILERELP